MNGTFLQVQQVTVPPIGPNTVHRLEARFTGSAIQALWDGSAVFTATVTDYQMATEHGLLWHSDDGQAQFDNFAVSTETGTGACTFGLDPTALSLTSGTTSGSVSVSTASGCAWASSTTASWIILSSPAGAGAASLPYTVLANNSPSARSATVTVETATLTVTQAAGASPPPPPPPPPPPGPGPEPAPVAGEPPAGTPLYYHADAIGSVRMITDQNGNEVSRHDYLPFGTEWFNPQGNPSGNRLFFTGKERDTETGAGTAWQPLDYLGARYYASQSGRFTTVDPVLDQQKALLDPQLWNRYTYVANRPLRFVDPDGKEPVTVALVLWGLYEIGSTAYDAYTAYRTLNDPNASTTERSITTGGFLAGVLLPGGGYGTAGRTLIRRADDLADAARAARGADDVVQFHHAFPKYLGGAAQQILEPLPKAVHDAFHSGLDKILPRQAGTKYYEKLSPAARRQLLKDLSDYTRAFDAKYGTQLYEAMIREGFPYQ